MTDTTDDDGKPAKPEDVHMLVGGRKDKQPAPEEPKPERSAKPQPEDEEKNDAGLWDDCPVEPLGVTGADYHYLDALRQHRVLSAAEHGRLGLMGLFSPRSDYLYKRWPRYGRDRARVAKAWRPELCAADMSDACSKQGIINASTIRERGAWPGEAGALIWHCGDEILTTDGWKKPGRIGDHIYPAGEKLPRPHEQPDVAAVEELRRLLLRWNWHRGELAAQLMLGWNCGAMLGGALPWRPNAWITGDWATGKSTLHEVLAGVMGPGGMISATDVSAAGIFQKLRRSTLPVAIDELENERDNTRTDAVVKLARQACSGGVVLRGGADHRGSEFTARSCFLFSSILLTGLLPQDRSRMAILELDRVDAAAKPPAIDRARLNEIGRHLRGRLWQQWPRFPETFVFYKQHLPCLSGRGADQFCTLLACADLALNDAVPTDGASIEAWVEALTQMRAYDRADEQPDYVRCAEHIVTSQMTYGSSGVPRTVGDWLHQARGKNPEADLGTDRQKADRALAAFGLKLITYVPGNDEGIAPGEYLAVANSHHALSALFQGTHWQTPLGRSGVWAQTLQRVPGARRATKQRFDSAVARCVVLPIEFINDPEGYVTNAYPNP